MKRKRIVVAACALLALPMLVSAFGQSPANSQEAERKVDLNRAGVEELIELPGIGEKVAERIVAYREENGPFEEPKEIMNVRGIGEKTFLKLEPHLTVTEKTRKKE